MLDTKRCYRANCVHFQTRKGQLIRSCMKTLVLVPIILPSTQFLSSEYYIFQSALKKNFLLATFWLALSNMIKLVTCTAWLDSNHTLVKYKEDAGWKETSEFTLEWVPVEACSLSWVSEMETFPRAWTLQKQRPAADCRVKSVQREVTFRSDLQVGWEKQ